MLYSRNVVNILTLMTKDGVVAPDFEDEIIAGSVVVHNGELKKEVVKK